MRTPLPQIVTLALFVCIGTLCVNASEQRDEQQSNSRRGNYGFGTREQTQTEQTTRVRERYSPAIKITPQKDDRSNTEKYGNIQGSGGRAVPAETYADDEATTPAPQTISDSSASGKIIEWSNDGVCEFRTDSGEKYHVKLWLVDMSKEGQPNYEKMMEFIRSHPVYGEGCGNVKLRIIAENPDKPEYKIGILTVSSSSSCQEAFWKSGYCRLDDNEYEFGRNADESKRLIRIFERIQEGKQGSEKYGAPRGGNSTSERATSAKNSQKGSDSDLVIAQVKNAPLFVEEAKKLIKDDTDKDAKDWLLIRAAKYGTPDAVEFLLENGVSPDVRDSAGSTALMEVAKRGDLKTAELLVKHGADVNAVGLYKNTAIFRAIENNHLDLAKFLVEHGADVNVQRTSDGHTAFMMAIDKNNWDAVKYLLEHGADVNIRLNETYGSYTPLMRVAARRDATDIVKLLVEHGADMSMKNRAGETPIDIAKKSGNTAVVNYFAEQEIVAMNSRSAADYKKLCDIIANDHTNDLSQLKDALETCIDPDAMRDAKTKHTVLHHVIWEDKRPAVVQMLLEYGADPNATKTDGGTCLRICIAKGHDDAEIANLLCDYGADVNAKGKDGKTPLDIAVARDKPKTGKVLRSYGATCTKKHKNVDTPTWKAILNRPQTRTPKHANTPKKSENTQTEPQSKDTGSSAWERARQSSVAGFGTRIKRDEALKGTLFDLKQSAKGAELATTAGNNAVKRKEQLHTALTSLDNKWDLNDLKKKYRAAQTTLYTTSIFIADDRGGPLDATKATEAFKDESGKKPFEAPGWLCYYEGYFSVPETGEYRFVGMGDDAMIVGVDRKTVLYAFWPGEGHGPYVKFRSDWEPVHFCGKDGNDGRGMAQGATGHRNMLYKGSWLHLAAGRYYRIQIAFGEAAGGKAGAWLGVQKKDRDDDDNFPLFTLEKVRPDSQLNISETGKYNTSRVFATPQK